MALLAALAWLLLALPAVAQDEAAGTEDWAGTWHSYWRGGQALLVLEQSGETVKGRYHPGNGSVDGRVRDGVFRGRWFQEGGSGQFEFALAPGGRAFVGRFGTGEYWNGSRLDTSTVFDPGYGNQTPQALMSSVLAAINAAREGNAAAELSLRRLIANLDQAEDTREDNQRVTRLARLIRNSAFRVIEVPEDVGADELSVEIGPSGTDWTFPLVLRRDMLGLWTLHLPEAAELEAHEEGLLEAADAPSLDAFERARRHTPRSAFRDFVRGTQTWHEGGMDRAMATLDLSRIPENLRSVDGPLAAEYLRQVIDRLGHPFWQGVPNDPDSTVPFLVYENAGGQILIDRSEEGGRWQFTAATLEAAPRVHDVVQNLPPLPGLAPPQPLTRAFWLRQKLRELSPALLERTLLLENWQWAALLLSIPVTTTGSWVAAAALRRLVRRVLAFGQAAPETQAVVARALGWPVRVNMIGVLIYFLVQELGLRQDVSAIAHGAAALLMVVGTTAFAYCLVDAVAGSLARSAAKTSTTIDDIAAAVGGGVARIAVIVGGIVFGAELLNLPYEGVIAALGVGGLAIGFAARDAVSNVISAGILLTDRPFRKGDLVEVNGVMGIVEEVGLRSTRLRTLEDAQLVVPNAKISEEQVSNWGKRRGRRVHLRMLAAIDTPRGRLDAFVEQLRTTFAAHPAAISEAVAALDDLTPDGITVALYGSFGIVSETEFLAAKHRLIGDVLDLARRLDVELVAAETEGDLDLSPSDPAFPVLERRQA